MSVVDEKILADKIEQYDYTFCIWTDRTDFLTEKALVDTDKLLEIRCFKDSGEFYAFRSSINASFKKREITENDTCFDGCFDEPHYLDIAAVTENGKENLVTAIGGGKYHLPIKDAEKILVRYYYKFDDNGIARKCDWRLVKFIAKEDKINEWTYSKQ